MCSASRWTLSLLCVCVWAAALLNGGAHAFHPMPQDDWDMNVLYVSAQRNRGCFPEEPYTHERFTQVALRRALLEFLRENLIAYSDAEALDAFADAQLDTDA